MVKDVEPHVDHLHGPAFSPIRCCDVPPSSVSDVPWSHGSRRPKQRVTGVIRNGSGILVQDDKEPEKTAQAVDDRKSLLR